MPSDAWVSHRGERRTIRLNDTNTTHAWVKTAKGMLMHSCIVYVTVESKAVVDKSKFSRRATFTCLCRYFLSIMSERYHSWRRLISQTLVLSPLFLLAPGPFFTWPLKRCEIADVEQRRCPGKPAVCTCPVRTCHFKPRRSPGSKADENLACYRLAEFVRTTLWQRLNRDDEDKHHRFQLMWSKRRRCSIIAVIIVEILFMLKPRDVTSRW